MLEILQEMANLGNDALTAFVVSQVLSFINCATIYGLLAWGVRTIWNEWKSRGFPIDL
jgi:uncharacterized protein (DUF2062 family)